MKSFIHVIALGIALLPALAWSQSYYGHHSRSDRYDHPHRPDYRQDYRYDNDGYDYPSRPIYRQGGLVCQDVAVVRTPRHHSNGGALLGALIGGALGNRVGHGDGRAAATIGGMVIGGAIGNRIQREEDRNRRYDGRYDDDVVYERQCWREY